MTSSGVASAVYMLMELGSNGLSNVTVKPLGVGVKLLTIGPRVTWMLALPLMAGEDVSVTVSV